jgi:hypothetical protein
MKLKLLNGCLVLLSALNLAGATATNPPVQGTAKPAAITAAALSEIPRSIFVYDPALRGKDPFNPTATRAAETPANGPKPPSLLAASSSVLTLKGIILGSKQRRLAVINNRDFAAGDTSEVTIPGGKVTVHCVEIGDGYAVVTVAGIAERHLLRMRQD